MYYHHTFPSGNFYLLNKIKLTNKYYKQLKTKNNGNCNFKPRNYSCYYNKNRL